MTGMTPDDVHELRWVGDPRVSPDGRRVAFVTHGVDRATNDYESTIWVAPVGGAPRQVTFGPGRDLQPRWSPDGERLAFVSDRAGPTRQLYVVGPDGWNPRRLTDLPEHVTDPVWAPAGDRLAFCARVPDPAYRQTDERRREPRRITRLSYKVDSVGWTADRRQHVFVVESDGSAAARQLTSGDAEDARPAWSPDGSTIAFVSARHPDWDIEPARDLYLVRAGGGEPRLLTSSDGVCDAPAWSPDGRVIAYHHTPGLWDIPRHTQISVVDVASGRRRILTESFGRNCSPHPFVREPVWVDGGRDVQFTAEDAGSVRLYQVRADGTAAPSWLTGGDQWITGHDQAAGVLASTVTTSTVPAELYVDGERVTNVTDAFTGSRRLVAPERFTATSADGTPVDAWLMRPVDFQQGQRYPVLLNVHGGPYTQYGHRFLDEFHVYSAAGYVVLWAEHRGSSGYSEEFERAVRGPAGGGPGKGTVDLADLMAVTDEALRRYPFCDADRLGVLGGSYGGFMTSWIVAHTDRFAAACSERAVNNWHSYHGSSDEGHLLGAEVGAAPYHDLQAYLRISPITAAGDITTPLLILHSENDLRCTVDQAEQLFAILRLRRQTVELVRFPGESHELSRSGSPAHRIMRLRIILDWFDRHLGNTAAA